MQQKTLIAFFNPKHGKGTAAEKIAVLEECGISVVKSPAEMTEALLRIFQPKVLTQAV